MDASQKIETAMEAARALSKGYREMSERAYPKTIREALAEGWEMDLSGFEIDIPDWFFYGVGEREDDRQRVLSMKRAQSILGQMEEEIVDKLIRNRTAILLRRLDRWRKVLAFIGENGDEMLAGIRAAAETFYEALSGVDWSQDWRRIWDEIADAASKAAAAVAAAILAGILLTIARVLTDGLDAVGPAAWLSTCAVIQGERRQTHRRLLSAAFPQKPAIRQWRRKETRL